MKKEIILFFLAFLLYFSQTNVLGQKPINYQKQVLQISDSLQKLEMIEDKDTILLLNIIELDRQKNDYEKAILKQKWKLQKDSLKKMYYVADEKYKILSNTSLRQKHKTSILYALLLIFVPLAFFFIYLYYTLKDKNNKQTKEEIEIREKEKIALASLGEMKEELVKYKSSIEGFSSHIDDLQRENEQLKDEIERVKVENSSLSGEIFKINQDNVALKELLDKTNNELIERTNQYDEEKRKRKQIFSTLQNIINEK